MKQDIHTE